jgi:hypothetical protein|tara:strand:- start:560 stop:676 length:117 start_codon:yes stop_codon:yes gene_type:complete
MQIKKQYQKNIINMIFIEKKLYLRHEIKKSKSLVVDQF